MATKKSSTSTPQAEGLTHNPFALLSRQPGLDQLMEQQPSTPVAPVKPPKPPPPCKVRMRLETKGRSGKVVTRILGLPRENLAAIASRLRKALGCGTSVEQDDLLLLGSLADRATEWLERAGDLRAITEEPTKAAPKPQPLVADPSGTPAASNASGCVRKDVRPGIRVAIVQKADQLTGTLTEGVVAELLTNSPEHPRGIKVRLESGEVGRVKVIYK